MTEGGQAGGPGRQGDHPEEACKRPNTSAVLWRQLDFLVFTPVTHTSMCAPWGKMHICFIAKSLMGPPQTLHDQ